MARMGITLLELIVVVAVFSLLFAIGIPSLHFFQRESSLLDAAEEIKNVLLSAQSKATASEAAQPHGVFFNGSSTPQEYTLFRGSSFASRDAALDRVYQLSKTIEFSQINFASGSEVVFNRISGETKQAGIVSLRLKDQPANTRTVSVDASGAVFVGTIAVPSDANRVKDSRHVHFDYSRLIDTSPDTSESIILAFTGNSGSVQQTIKMSDYLLAGNFVWSGSVTVDGEAQQLEIRTHRLNNPDTQFSITRDRRKNAKALQVSLSGDGTGDLIRYAADGVTTKGTSFYVSDPIWQ